MTHENKLYKYIVDTAEMLDLVLKTQSMLLVQQSQCQLPIGVRTFGLKNFLVFPMLIFPMTREEAIQCLPKFVESVAKAIHSLHQLGLAHLDVRLENVCFRAYTG